MQKEDHIKELSEFGLSERESRLYLAMLEKNESTASQLHRISGITRSKVYELLQHMLNKGFCLERLEGRNRYFRAVPPTEVKQFLRKQIEIEKDKKLSDAEELFASLEKQYSNLDLDTSLDVIEVLRNRIQVHQKYLELLDSTQKELLSFNCAPYPRIDKSCLKRQSEALSRLYARGVLVRSIYKVEDRQQNKLLTHLKISSLMGEEHRLAPDLPLKMYVSDKQKVMLALNTKVKQSNSDFTMIAIQDSGVALGCSILFNTLWKSALTRNEWKIQEMNE